jgi:cytoskeleton-associated protein 5
LYSTNAEEKTPNTNQSAAARGSSASKSDLPRVDISSKITPQLLQNMEDQDWRKRQEALQQVEQILNEANKHIQPKLGGTTFNKIE